MRNLSLITILTLLFSCESKTHDKILAAKSDSLKSYQKYSLDMLTKFISDKDYKVTDSFHLWAYGYIGKLWKPFYITKTINDGLYSYIFWKEVNDNFVIYKETQASKIGFVADSLYDANGDDFKDLVITDNTINGQCQPNFSQLFCFDIDQEEFVEVEQINSLPNVTFHPRDKTVYGEWECKMTKEIYKLKWTKKYQLDTIYYKTINL